MRLLFAMLCLVLVSGCTAMILGDSRAGGYDGVKSECAKKGDRECDAE